jgi:hypothetical protein
VEKTFRKQLFTEEKLHRIKGKWNVLSCVIPSLVPEISEINFQPHETKQQVIDRIHQIIDERFSFLGYLEFAKHLEKLQTNLHTLQTEFNGRLVIIDEFYNLRVALDVYHKRSAASSSRSSSPHSNLEFLLDNADNLRLLLLSSQPRYDSYNEILWTLNLLRRNDKRPLIAEREIFVSDKILTAQFRPTTTTTVFQAEGKAKLIESARGYVLFVKEASPFTFPFCIYPHIAQTRFPSIQMNRKYIQRNKQLSFLNNQLTCVKIKKSQFDVYRSLLDNTNPSVIISENEKGIIPENEGLLLQCLNIAYPPERSREMAEEKENDPSNIVENPEACVGKVGLSRIMTFEDTKERFGAFEYRSSFYRGFFDLPNLGHYSCKMEAICNKVKESKGVIVIYSQYLAGGLIPMALALETMGIHRYHSVHQTGTKNLLQSPGPFSGSSYVLITGDKRLSPNNQEEIEKASSVLNRDGNLIKVILMTVTGAEGFELKYVRQVHLLDPCYTLSQTERIVGFATRNFSHEALPMEERNVQIFMYATLLRKENAIIESFDMYMYRRAEKGAILLGQVTRALKEGSLNACFKYKEPNYTHRHLVEEGMGYVTQRLSDGTILEKYPVGDMSYSANCDYMKECEVTFPAISGKDKQVCEDFKGPNDVEPDSDYFSDDDEQEEEEETKIQQSKDEIVSKVKRMFRKGYLYNYEKLYKAIKPSNDSLVYQVLSRMIEDRIPLHDKYSREGYLINVGEYYLFQPKELSTIPFHKHDFNIPRIDQRHSLRNKHTQLLKQMEAPRTKEEQEQQQEQDTVEQENPTYLEKDNLNYIYNTIQTYYKSPSKIRGTGYTFLSGLGLAAATLSQIMNVKKQDILQMAVECVIDAMAYDEKVFLMQSFFHGTFNKQKELKHILESYFGKKIHTFGPEGTTVVILYQGEEQLAPVVITETNEVVALEEYEDLKAVKKYLHAYHRKYDRRKLHYPLGIISCNNPTNAKDRKEPCRFMIMESPTHKGVECVSKGVQSYFEKIIPSELQEVFRPIYTSIPGPLLCTLLRLTMKYFNIRFPEKVWYLSMEESQAIFQEVDISEYVRDTVAEDEEENY